MPTPSDSTALLIIDMQVHCFEGQPPRHDAEGIVKRINALSAAMRGRSLILYVQHTDPADGYERGSAAWQILPSLVVAEGDEKIEKAACDAFLETPLKELLDARGIRDLVIVGCATDFCVDTTVRTAAALGFNVTVVSDAHTTRDRPHLDAVTIIKHHNYMWDDLILPRGRRIKLLTTEAFLKTL
jgi:nicotinamidase-related amidase